MVIARIGAGFGNQLDQYAVGRYLAIKLNTELKLDVTNFFVDGFFVNDLHGITNYRLGAFNIFEVFATPEEINHVKETGKTPTSTKDLENIQGDVYIEGHWMHNPQLYKDIADILKREFTLKKPFNPVAEMWNKKILSAKYSVSIHFRHGDYDYAPWHRGVAWAGILPLDYYQTCIDILKQRYSNLTVFVFSDNMQWVKENLHLDVPTEFVEGCETDLEEWVLMSRCKHNIIASSTFSRSAAWFNLNPDKKIFAPFKSTAQGVQQFLASLTPEKKESILDRLNPELTGNWAWIPYDFDNQPKITQQPIFSLLLVVNNDAVNLSATLNSLLNQDYKYYEVVIIDNASTDGSDKICQQAIEGKTKVTYKRLAEKVNNATAWNEAIKVVQGKYVSFLKVGDQFIYSSLTRIYPVCGYRPADIIHMFSYLKEDTGGNITFGNKKFSEQRDEKFKQEQSKTMLKRDSLEAVQLLINREINSFLGTKLYNVEFLTEQGIKFDEALDNEATEISFQKETFLKSKHFLYLSNALYIAPKV